MPLKLVMSLKIWTKLVVLLTALTFTIVAIFWLKQSHMSAFWTSLGLGSSKKRINWCDERVKSLYVFGNDTKIFEENGKWFWSQDHKEELDYLRVEKWFAKYCHIDIDEVLEAPLDHPLPIFEAQFLHDERVTLYSDIHENFKIGPHQFKSETLRQALKELLAFGPKIE